MKTETRRMRNWWMGALLLWLAFAPLAQAFYNPSTGKWLSRDPVEELGGLDLYGFVGNTGINKVDRDGRVAVADDAIILAAVGTIAACAAAEAWLQSPAGKQAIHNITMAATSVADAIAEGVKTAVDK